MDLKRLIFEFECRLPYCLSVLLERVLTLLLELPLILFLLFLFLNDTKELISLSLGLLRKHDFLLQELSLASHIKVLGHLSLLLHALSFLSAGHSLALFECSLGSQSIDLPLAVSCLLLKFSKSLDLLFFLILETSLLG